VAGAAAGVPDRDAANGGWVSSAIHTSCDTGVAKAETRHYPPRHPNLVLATTILASSLAFIDGSVVNVGLPAISATFHAGAEDLQWVVNAYLLPLSALLLLGGGAGDRFGRVRFLVIGVLIFFGVASVACASAPGLPCLLLARGLQGIGAALLMSNSLAILGSSFSGEARGRAIGVWASMGAVMGAGGPALGGWLIDTVGWRSIFLVNIPLAAGAVVLALAVVRDAPTDQKSQPLDIRGGVLATLGLGGVIWGLTIGSGSAEWTIAALDLLAAGFGLLIAFVWIEKIRGENAMMPLALFGSNRAVRRPRSEWPPLARGPSFAEYCNTATLDTARGCARHPPPQQCNTRSGVQFVRFRQAGDGQVVLISGEPGLGKSRLTAALGERLHAEPHLADAPAHFPSDGRRRARVRARGQYSGSAVRAHLKLTSASAAV
jgi:MFS family permease